MTGAKTEAMTKAKTGAGAGVETGAGVATGAAVWALVPVKDLARAKGRLSGVLAPRQRRRLVRFMLEDVLSALAGLVEPGGMPRGGPQGGSRGTLRGRLWGILKGTLRGRSRGRPQGESRGMSKGMLRGILLVSDDRAVARLARKYPVVVLTESELGCSGLNPAITAATEWLAREGATDIMVVHGDLPLARAADLGAALDAYWQGGADAGTAQPPTGHGQAAPVAHRQEAIDPGGLQPPVDDGQIVLDASPPAGANLLLAPDLAGTGTNLMIYPARNPPVFHYGPGSCAAHLASARERGLVARVFRNPRLGLDVDSSEDLQRLYNAQRTPAHEPRPTRP